MHAAGHRTAGSGHHVSVRGTRVGIPGWVYWVGSRRGYTGVLPSCLKAEAPDSEAGPGRPAGAGVGGQEVQRPPEPQDHHSRPLQGLPGPLRCPGPLPAGCRLWANRGEIKVKLM